MSNHCTCSDLSPALQATYCCSYCFDTDADNAQ